MRTVENRDRDHPVFAIDRPKHMGPGESLQPKLHPSPEAAAFERTKKVAPPPISVKSGLAGNWYAMSLVWRHGNRDLRDARIVAFPSRPIDVDVAVENPDHRMLSDSSQIYVLSLGFQDGW